MLLTSPATLLPDAWDSPAMTADPAVRRAAREPPASQGFGFFFAA